MEGMLRELVAEKNPAIDEGEALTTFEDKLAVLMTLPVPTTEGISRKLSGMLSDALTTFSKILSLLYCSMTSLYAVDIDLKLVELVAIHPVNKLIVRIKVDFIGFMVARFIVCTLEISLAILRELTSLLRKLSSLTFLCLPFVGIGKFLSCL